MREQTVAIVGATGAVGLEIIKLLSDRAFPVSELRLFASDRSEGKTLPFGKETISVQKLDSKSFGGIDFAFFSAGSSRSREFAPIAVQSGAIVIDNSSAFRMDSAVPLVLPEVNGILVTDRTRLISVPNCSAIILIAAIHPLLALAEIERIIVSTYQSASGGGGAMMQRLLDETSSAVKGEKFSVPNDKYPPYAFNLFSHNTPVDESGANQEESKVINETRKILKLPNLRMNVTCIRVPVLRAHSESVTVEFLKARPTLSEIRAIYSATSGIELVDDRENNHFPTPLEASNQANVLVGRLRNDPSNDKATSLFISGDQLLKGAAVTAVEIAELCLKSKLTASR